MGDAGGWSERWSVDAHDGGGFHLDVHDDRIATTGADGFVRSWDADDGRPAQEIQLGPGWARATATASSSARAVAASGIAAASR